MKIQRIVEFLDSKGNVVKTQKKSIPWDCPRGYEESFFSKVCEELRAKSFSFHIGKMNIVDDSLTKINENEYKYNVRTVLTFEYDQCITLKLVK